MRGTVTKKLRQHIRKHYNFMADAALYQQNEVTGVVTLAPATKRGLYQHMKRELKRRKTDG